MKIPTVFSRPSTWFITMLFLLVMVQCKSKGDHLTAINTAFTEKIVAFTAGVISSESPIQIVLAEDYNVVVTQLTLSLGKSAGTGHIKLSNKGKGMLFTRVIMEGIPEAGNEKDFNNNLGMHIGYLTPEGRTMDIARLTQGTDFVAVVTLSNPGDFDYRDMALAQVFPPGWEINNTRMSDAEIPANSAAYSYQDIRDDRIYTYFDLLQGERKTFIVQLNAAYLAGFTCRVPNPRPCTTTASVL